MKKNIKQDFENWSKEKERINSLESIEKHPKPREIWFVKMWINIWNEQNWKNKFLRPVLIIKKIWILLFCIALTTKNKDSFFYKKLNKATFYKEYEVKESVIIMSQWKIYDKKRFIKQIWYLEECEFLEIKKQLKSLYF